MKAKTNDIIFAISVLMAGLATLILATGFVYASFTDKLDRPAPRSCAPEWALYYQNLDNAGSQAAGPFLGAALACEEEKGKEK